jgi:hypothetical protein
VDRAESLKWAEIALDHILHECVTADREGEEHRAAVLTYMQEYIEARDGIRKLRGQG